MLDDEGRVVPVLTVLAPKDARVFLDGALAGRGPRVTVLPSTGEHELGLLAPGAGLSRRRFRFPAEREIDLASRARPSTNQGDAP